MTNNYNVSKFYTQFSENPQLVSRQKGSGSGNAIGLLPHMLNVAIKFCGGCNPTFDRIAYWSRIREAAGGHFNWVPLAESQDGTILLITGCARTCPEGNLPRVSPRLTLCNQELDPQDVVHELAKMEVYRENCNQGRLH